MLDTELLRAICKELIAEKDLERLQELLSLLCAVVDEDEEEIRAKMPLLLAAIPFSERTFSRRKEQAEVEGKGPRQ